MQKYYQEAADKLQNVVEEVVTLLKKELVEKGVNTDAIPKQPMAVEIVSFALIKCLIEERLAFNEFEDEQQARIEALEIIKAAVIKYRGQNLVPPRRH